jgi:phosphonate transport system substrate-binding protein
MLLRFPFQAFVSCFLFCVALLFSAFSRAETYTVGVVPQFNTKKIHQIWMPILKEVGERTGHTFQLKGSSDITGFETSLANSDFDLAYMNPYHHVINPQYEPVVRDHGRKLFGILVIKKNGGIKSIEDLQGKTLHFPAPNALGASLMIRAELNNKFGINFETKYVKTHSSVFLNTALGLASAGGAVQKTLSRQPETIKEKLHILHKTQKVTPHPLTVHKRVPKDVFQAIQRSLIEYSKTDVGKLALQRVPFKTLGTAQASDYQSVSDLNLDQFYIKPN